MLTFDSAAQEFLCYCRSKNLSHKTVDWYRYRLKYCAEFFNNKGLCLGDITINDLREMVSQQLDHLSVTTANHTAVAVKTFFKYLHEEGHLTSNPAYRLEQLKGAGKLIEPFSEEQLQAILAAPNIRRFAGTRDRTLMLLLLDTALRVSEAINIKLSDIDWQHNVIKVMGKGSKERIVPFGRAMKAELRKYMERRGETNNEYLFITEYGEHLSVKQIQDSITVCGKKAGITGIRVSPHTFRHTAAVNWIRNGGDAFTLQRLLGHTSLDTVKIYINLANRDLENAHRILSPVDRMFNGICPQKQEGPRKRLK